MGPISAAHGGDDAFFCAIDAEGQQGVVYWAKNSTSPFESPGNFSAAVAAFSSSEGFMCGALANTSQAYCWDSSGSGINVVPSAFRLNSYFHVCVIRGLYYVSDNNSGSVDCWDVLRRSTDSTGGGGFIASDQRSLFHDENISHLLFKNLVSGDGFSCGSLIDDSGLFCWGSNSSVL